MMKFLLFGALFCLPAAGLKMGRVYREAPKNSSTQLNLARTTGLAQWTSCFANGDGCKKMLGPLGAVCCKWCPHSVNCDTFWTKKTGPAKAMITWYGGDPTCDVPQQTMEITGFPQNPGLPAPKAGFKLYDYMAGAGFFPADSYEAAMAPATCMTVKLTKNIMYEDDPRSDIKSIKCACLGGSGPYGDNHNSPWIECQPFAQPDCTFETLNAPRIAFFNLDQWYVPRKGKCWANRFANSQPMVNGLQNDPQNLFGPFFGGSSVGQGANYRDANGLNFVDSTVELYDQDLSKCYVMPAGNW